MEKSTIWRCISYWKRWMFISILVEPARYISSPFLHSWFQGGNSLKFASKPCDDSRYEPPRQLWVANSYWIWQTCYSAIFLVYRGYTVCIEGQTAEYLTCFMLPINAMGKVSISTVNVGSILAPTVVMNRSLNRRNRFSREFLVGEIFLIGWLHNSCDTVWNLSNIGCLDVQKFIFARSWSETLLQG